MEETVLIYIEKDDKYLMMIRNKKENDLNQGKYIGIGGHINSGESKEEALSREVKEETNLTLNSFIYRGKLTFVNNNYTEMIHLYTSNDYSGKINYDCNERDLIWVKKENLLDVPLWEGDKKFLKILINTNEYFEMALTYSNDKLVKAERTK